ncbi:hypothetical protein L211DRAFT_851264 [Terfezia boudieri ATCC MYA-4762]|uniref:Uncharacterized protein n=1 Tax=Terfezia boudieri ATCC MYA-4762 TaxID=1051890 RepID=A0A3N4LG03_9PEZI|nr:hypothetical protein L211DRAFT_851264 [Terfezia boudieri ATCC MYA-4762]
MVLEQAKLSIVGFWYGLSDGLCALLFVFFWDMGYFFYICFMVFYGACIWDYDFVVVDSVDQKSNSLVRVSDTIYEDLTVEQPCSSVGYDIRRFDSRTALFECQIPAEACSDVKYKNDVIRTLIAEQETCGLGQPIGGYVGNGKGRL